MTKSLSPAMRRMLIDSHPSDRDPTEGTGIELRSGADYAVAKALERRELGSRTGPGGFLPGMYWNNEAGLVLRSELLREEHRSPDDDFDFDDDDEDWSDCGMYLDGTCSLAGSEECDQCPYS